MGEGRGGKTKKRREKEGRERQRKENDTIHLFICPVPTPIRAVRGKDLTLESPCRFPVGVAGTHAQVLSAHFQVRISRKVGQKYIWGLHQAL